MWISLLVLTPLLAALELRAEHRGLRRQVYLFKPLATLCLAAIAATTPLPVSETYRALVVLGLLCSLAGDVVLMLPRDRFVAGLLCFLLAHVCYIAAFVSLGGLPRSPAAALLLAAYGLYLLRRLWPRLGRYRLPVAVYAAALLFMVAAAHAQLREAGFLRSLLALSGAVLFAFSDSVLALDRFERGGKPRRLLVLSTYFAAQWLIAVSVFQKPSPLS